MLTSCSPQSMSAPLRVDMAYPSPGTVRAAAVGEVDLATAQVLRDALLSALREHRPALLTVDVSGVTFLDCTGISALVAAHAAAARAGCQLWVTGSRPMVHRVLGLTGLLTVLVAPADRARRSAPIVADRCVAGSTRGSAPRHPEWPIAA
jgi:anti-anti-sigma factor